jgi:hypothetical protein
VTLQYVGSLPTNGLQIGLVATLPGIAAKIAGLQSLVPELQAAIAGKATMAVNVPPNITGFTAAAGAYLNVGSLAALLNPAAWVSVGASANADIVAKLGLIIPKIELLASISGVLTVGLSAGGIAEWAYRGPCQAFGVRLDSALTRSSGGITRDETVSGLVIVCEDGASWNSFGRGFNVGSPSPGEVEFVGSLTGGEVVTGLRLPMLEIEAYLAELNGTRLALEANLELSLGVGLPSVGELLNAGLNLDLSAAIGSLVEIDVSIQAELEALLGKIDVLLDLQGNISASLSGGGLSVWRFSGLIGELGNELVATLESGIPGGTGSLANVGAVAIACDSPSAWGAFGNLVAV